VLTRERVLVNLHLSIKPQVSLLDSSLDTLPEHPAIINGVGVGVMETAILLVLHPISTQNRMIRLELDATLIHQQFKQSISLGHIKVIGSLVLLGPTLVH